MLHHHCVTADPQWACNVFSRVICGSSQSRATLDVSHCHLRVGHKSAGLILNRTYDAAGIFLCEAKNGQCKGDDKHKQHAGIHRARHAILPWVRRRREHVLRITAEVNSLMLFSQRIDELRYSYERLLLLSDRSVCQDQKIAYSSACRPHAPEGRISRKIPPAGRSRFSGEWMCI